MTLDDVLEEVRADLEERIKRQLFGLQGLVVRPFYNSMMPLHVEVSSTPQLFDLAFLEDGRVELKHGTGSNADLRIESDSQTFSSLFRSPSAKLFNELENIHNLAPDEPKGE
jgi:hypothetical protein